MHIGDRVQWTASHSITTAGGVSSLLKRGPTQPTSVLNKITTTTINNSNHLRQYYEGNVSWIGHLVELGTGWAAGVEFVSIPFFVYLCVCVCVCVCVCECIQLFIDYYKL